MASARPTRGSLHPMEFHDFAVEVARSGRVLSLAFDDGELVSMRDGDGHGEVPILGADEKTAAAAATGDWDDAEVVGLDTRWLMSWLEGFGPDGRAALLLGKDDPLVFEAPVVARAIWEALEDHDHAPLPLAGSQEPGAMGKAEVTRLDEADSDEQVAFFARECARTGTAWGLWDASGWVSFRRDGQGDAVPFWPHPKLAERCAKGRWDGASPRAVDGAELLRWLAYSEQAGKGLALMLTPDDEWADAAARDVAAKLLQQRADR